MKIKEALEKLYAGDFAFIEGASLSDLRRIEEAMSLDQIARLVLADGKYKVIAKDPSKIQDFRISTKIPQEINSPTDLLVFMLKQKLMPTDLIEKFKAIRTSKGLKDTRDIIAAFLRAEPSLNELLGKFISGGTTKKDIEGAIEKSDNGQISRQGLQAVASR